MNLSELPIITGGEYLMKALGISKEDAYSAKYAKESEMVETIITLETGYYMSRRVRGGWGHLEDNFLNLRRKAIDDYEKEFNVNYQYYNEEFL